MRRLKETLNATVSALASTLATKDHHFAGHQERVAQLACAIGQKMEISPDLLKGLRMIGFLHDMGKIAIPQDILCKTSRLSEYEFNLIKGHPIIGYGILMEMGFPRRIARAVLQHHERLDGSGYPFGLLGQDILLEAKILSVADVTDAMVSDRPYRPAIDLKKSLEEIWRNNGILYDTDVVTACLSLFMEEGFDYK